MHDGIGETVFVFFDIRRPHNEFSIPAFLVHISANHRKNHNIRLRKYTDLLVFT